MRLFLKKLLIFLIPVAAALGYFEYTLKDLVNIYNYKKEILDKNLDSVQVVMLGSSRDLYAFDPKLVKEKAINLAIPNKSIYYDCEIIKRYLIKAKNLKAVIIPVSNFSLDSNLTGDNMVFLNRFWGIEPPANTKDSVSDFQKYSFTALYSKDVLANLKSAKQTIATGVNPTGIDENGWKEQSFESSSLKILTKEEALKRVVYHNAITFKEDVGFNMKELEEAIIALQAKKVSVYLVTTPVYHTYSSQIDRGQYEEMRKNIDFFVKKYNISYRNYFLDERFVAEDFANNDHLNVNGTKKFTKIIASEVLNES